MGILFAALPTPWQLSPRTFLTFCHLFWLFFSSCSSFGCLPFFIYSPTGVVGVGANVKIHLFLRAFFVACVFVCGS